MTHPDFARRLAIRAEMKQSELAAAAHSYHCPHCDFPHNAYGGCGYCYPECFFAVAVDSTTGTVREYGALERTRDGAEEDAEALAAKWTLATTVRVVAPHDEAA